MARVAACRHYVEQSLELAKGDVGLDEYEVRSWVGWHHHMTLSLLSLLFLVGERIRIKKNAGHHSATGSLGDGTPLGTRRALGSGHRQNRRAGRPPTSSQRGGSAQSLAQVAPSRATEKTLQNTLD